MKELLLIAGHGQGDPGAGGNGYDEADLTREVVALMTPFLDKYGIDYDVYPIAKNMYKNSDAKNYTDYREIIEIHFNSTTASSTGIGTEILIHQDYINIPDALDKALLASLVTYWKNRGFKGRNNLANMNTYRKLKKSYRLLEVCFISDSKDMQIYQANKKQLAEKMSIDIAKKFNKYNETTPPVTPPVDPPVDPVPTVKTVYLVQDNKTIGELKYY